MHSSQGTSCAPSALPRSVRKSVPPRPSYYRARYYDPTIGRFLAEDMIGWFGEDVNFYRYASNRPSMFIDLGPVTEPCQD
jgi:hypothetical protein